MSSTSIQIVKGTLPHQQSQSFPFASKVHSMMVAINAISLQYQESDHNVQTINVDAHLSLPDENTVEVTATALMEDASGHVAQGSIGFQLMVILEQQQEEGTYHRR